MKKENYLKKDKWIWVSRNKGERNGIHDLLAGWRFPKPYGQGGYHIAAMILFCEKHKKTWNNYRQNQWLEDLLKKEDEKRKNRRLEKRV